MATVDTLSHIRCTLGEGPMWHPGRQTLIWFDILGHKMFESGLGKQSGPGGQAEGAQSWAFDRAVSAAGWVDDHRLLVATARDLVLFDLSDGRETPVAPLEADTPATRSNDGRADPQGGFWIGTMGYTPAPGLGAIYRFYKGEVRRLFDGISIPNAICFAPDGRSACFADTPTRIIRRVALDAEGWPVGAPAPFIDLRADGLNPDGAVIDTEGRLWNAQWGASRVACYGPDGGFLRAVSFPASQMTCPAFGGAGLSRLFATSASEGDGASEAAAGTTFCVDLDGVTGQTEHRVLL